MNLPDARKLLDARGPIGVRRTGGPSPHHITPGDEPFKARRQVSQVLCSQYFDLGQGEVHMDYEVQDWFNNVIVDEYNNFVDRLQEDARELRNKFGDSVKRGAESVVKIRRLTV